MGSLEGRTRGVGSGSGQREPGQRLPRKRTHRLSCRCRGGGCGVSDKLKRKREEGGRKTDRRGGEAEGAESACSTASEQREESARRSDSWGASAMAGTRIASVAQALW